MTQIKKISVSGMMLAVALWLPFLTGQIPQIGSALSPMHIPVLLCGFVCGWQYGLIVGAIAPALRFLLFQMPPIFPTGLAMTFELATYGACAGILYAAFPKKKINVYISLILSMLIGRLVWGIAMYSISQLAVDVKFDFNVFLAGAFMNAIPGVVLHIVLIPVIVMALKRAGLILNE